MSEINSWTEIYSLGALLIQLAFLFAGVWFARNLIGAMRVFQEQIGALLKLWISSDPTGGAQTRRRVADLNQYWLMPSDRPPTPDEPEPAEDDPGRVAGAWHHFALWLQEPMYSMEMPMWRRFVGWLQAPSGS